MTHLHSAAFYRTKKHFIEEAIYTIFNSVCLRKSALNNQILSHQLLITVLSTSVLLTHRAPLPPLFSVSSAERCEHTTTLRWRLEPHTLVTTCYAWSPQHGHELELKSVRWTDCHEIICTSKSILLLSNREALTVEPVWGRVLLIVCSQRHKNT